MISRAQEPEQLYAEGGITSIRQPFFLGKIAKKIGKGVKKVVKSPIGKAALIGGGLWGLNKWGPLAGKISPMFSGGWDKFKGLGLGKQALLGLGAAGMALPFMADEEEVVEELPWETTPDSIANIRDMTRNRDSSLAFLPSSIYAQPGYYNMAKGGRAGLMNGGGAAEAQAENMLKMEYQKYRNQGGTMSYQQFKMEVLKQAQGQGPMAQTQPQMMNKGGRSGYALGERVEGQELEGVKLASDPGMGEGPFMLEEFLQAVKDGYKGTYEDFINDIDRSPADYLAQGGRAGYRLGELVEDQESMFMTPQGDEVVTDQMEEIEGQTAGPAWFEERLNILMDLGYDYETAGEIARNTPEYLQIIAEVGGFAQGGRIGAQEGGLMNLGGMEKDYRQEGGFVPIGGKEKADDVPARLSKNEFVFTADAVRAAGGGDIDQGAAVMENLMENLEAGGKVSEESQGLEGARGMFANTQRLQNRII